MLFVLYLTVEILSIGGICGLFIYVWRVFFFLIWCEGRREENGRWNSSKCQSGIMTMEIEINLLGLINTFGFEYEIINLILPPNQCTHQCSFSDFCRVFKICIIFITECNLDGLVFIFFFFCCFRSDFVLGVIWFYLKHFYRIIDLFGSSFCFFMWKFDLISVLFSFSFLFLLSSFCRRFFFILIVFFSSSF